jgi:hypothetical protein
LSPARLIAALLLVLPGFAFAQVCQCIDIGDIKARQKEATTAIETYGAEMNKMMEQMQRTQQPLPYTPERRQKLQGRVQDALNKVSAGRIPTLPTMGDNPGGTDNLCNIVSGAHPSATACMKESVRVHEEYHRAECKKTLTAGKVGTSIATGKDRFERDGIQLHQYAMEEVAAYTEEVKFLSAEAARLAQACKPKAPPPERDYTAEQRNRAPKNQKPADPVKSGIDEVRKRLGF